MTAAELLRAAPLPRSFYERGALELAPDLLGKVVVHRSREGICAGRIVEVEAYCGPKDRAAHSYGGRRTERNEVMWGPAGHLYVYFVYGMHWCMNVVGAGEGVPEAVLLRGLEPVAGLALIRRRRGVRPRDTELLRGPANLCKGLGVHRHHNGVDLTDGPIRLLAAAAVPARAIRRSGRIGVDYAGAHARRRWRFYVVGSPGVSGPAAMRRGPIR